MATKLSATEQKLAAAQQSDLMKTQLMETLNQEIQKKDAAIAKATVQEKQLTDTITKLTMQLQMLAMN